MKKRSIIFVFLFILLNCFCVSCTVNENNNDLILPGKDRIWWDKGFNNTSEASDFIIQLKNANKNGDFHFGVSSFNLPINFEEHSITFSGHININCSNKEDIYNSSYDYFEILYMYYEDQISAQTYDRFEIYYYPFYVEDGSVINNEIKYDILDYYDGACDIHFKYDDSMIMKVKLSKQSNSQIDKTLLINDLIKNYKILV
ncbi:MAG: hypothetical protein SO253_06245 [Bacilli bacterium]|nr:hypothetical protein [Bacilli bacterium]